MPCRCALSAPIVTRSVMVAVLHACAPYPRDWAASEHCRTCDLPATFPLQPDRAGGVLTEQGALADVAAKHGRALVTGLLGDDALGYPDSSSRGRKASPQRVTGHLAGVESSSGSEALQHECHRLGTESRCADVAMAVHGAEGRSLDDARDLEPRPPGTDRASERVRPVW